MASGQQRILRNTSYLTVGFVVQKILSFVYFIFVAKALGPYDLGLYDPAKALIPILLILIDFSLSPVLTREVAREPKKAFLYLANILSIKAIFGVILLILFGVITNFSSFGAIERSIIYLIALVVAFDSFTATFFAVFRGLQNMKFEAFGMIITQLATIAVGLLALQYGYGIRGLFLATLMGSVINFIYSFVILRKKLGNFPSFRWEKNIIRTFLKIAVPFALSAILAKIFTYTDRFILLLQAGRESVGYYATAHKLTFALEFLPASFAAAFYPAMSAHFITDKTQLGKTFERALFYLILISIPIAIGANVFAQNIFFTLWEGDYLRSVIPFQIMISATIVIFLNFPVGSFLNATNNQKINTINMAITVLVNVVLNLLLVEKYQHVGAAIATATSLLVLFVLGLRKVGHVTTYDKQHLIRAFIGSLVLSVLISVPLYFVRDNVHLFILIPIFIILYCIGLFILKIITKNDLGLIKQAFSRKRA